MTNSKSIIKKPKTKAPAKIKAKGIVENVSAILGTSEHELVRSTGFKGNDSEVMLYSVLKMLLSDEGDPAQTKRKVSRFFSAMAGLKPQDPFEGLLISQMVTTYEASMDCFRMAVSNKKFPEVFFKLQNQGVKLMRLYCQQLESLDKHRRKGKQSMTIEHVHVQSGGQAVIGNVSQGDKGGNHEK